jgi:hypothetical protein
MEKFLAGVSPFPDSRVSATEKVTPSLQSQELHKAKRKDYDFEERVYAMGSTLFNETYDFEISTAAKAVCCSPLVIWLDRDAKMKSGFPTICEWPLSS